METKINIAEILKNKQKGTKLYTDAFGELSIEDIFAEDEIGINLSTKDGDDLYFYNDGKYNVHGEPILFPSREMRDWSKFSLKKGDVLANGYGDYCLFKEFAHPSYQTIKAVFIKRGKESIHSDSCLLDTKDWHKASPSCTATYINSIEEKLGGKLNRETLEIEKAKSEFKDGDILSIQEDKEHYHTIFILKGGTDVYVFFDYFHRVLTYGTKIDKNEKSICRLATEDEKKVLFKALANEGKAWDAEKKQIVDLKPKVEFKPFDKVLVRHQKTEEWSANIFSHTDKTVEYLDYVCVNGRWEFCIPYEGNEYLLGTTKDVEG